MTNPIGRFQDVETGETIDRPLTDAEYEDLINPKPVKMPWEVNETPTK